MATSKKIILALEEDPPEDSIETLHVYPFEGGILVTREELEPEHITPSKPPRSQNEKYALPFVLAILCFLICIDTMLFSFLASLLPTATITIIPVERDITLRTTITVVTTNPSAGQVQGRILPTLTLSQTKTVPATGRGHQDATFAAGTITFYNGLLTAQTIAAGTILTGADEVQVTTDQNANIPAAFPPTEGSVTIPAHALQRGSRGNIRGQDINMACCATAVLAINVSPFHGGQDARDFQYVAKGDVETASAQLKGTVSQSMVSALQGETQPGEAFIPSMCTPSMQTDHRIGDESSSLIVTVSESCNATAYDKAAFQKEAEQAEIANAMKQLGLSYFPFGPMHPTILTVVQTPGQQEIASICVSVEGLWVYQMSHADKARMKELVRGKTKEEALKTLLGMPGIKRVFIAGAENATLPANPSYIQIILVYGGF